MPKIYSEALYNRLADVREKTSPSNLREIERSVNERKTFQGRRCMRERTAPPKLEAKINLRI